jgi:hypothetical protein
MQSFPLELANALLTFSEFGNVYIKMETRNYIKYYKRIQRESIVTTNFKNKLRSNIKMRIKNPEVRNLRDSISFLQK